MATTTWRELRLAVRRLLRAPGFTLASVLTLGLALGMVTGVYGLVDAALLRPLPYAEAERLVSVNETVRGEEISVAWPNFEDWRAAVSTLDALEAYRRANLNLTGDDGPAQRVRGLEVTSGLLPLLGVEPVAGRLFGADADAPGAPREVVLTHGLWTERFGADPGVVGRDVRLDGQPWTVVGVAPPGFAFPDGIVLASSDLFLPIGPSVPLMQDRGSHPALYALGRLAPGRTLGDARRELDALAGRLSAEHPDTNRDEGVRVLTALERVVGDVRPALTFLAAAAALVLLVACANVSGLFLARASERSGEDRVRLALGAGRGRLLARLLAEAGLLAAAGGALGLLLARAGLAAVLPNLASFGRLAEAGVDGRVALAALAVAPLVAVLVAALPALRGLPRAGAGVPGTRGTGGAGARARSALVAGQMAVALALLVAGGLLVRGFVRLAAEDGGVRTAGVLTFQIGLPDAYDGGRALQEGRRPERSAAAFFDALEARLATLPGVASVGAISTLPFSGSGAQSGMLPEDGGEGLPEGGVRTDVAVVTPGYFETMGVELLAGRLFDDGDGPESTPVVVVDERLARRFWPGRDPLGRRVEGWGLPSATVVGVVRHVKSYGVAAPSREELYMPHAQRAYVRMTGVVRVTDGDPAALAPAVRAVVPELDPDVPLASVRTMAEVVELTVSEPRLAAVLGGATAGLAALLAVLGLYALVAFTVAGRTREIGVRMALGADRGRVRRAVVAEGVRLAAVGVVAGIALAFVGARGLAGLVYGVPLTDPWTYGGAAALLVAVAALATWIPARRASGVEPSEALRA